VKPVSEVARAETERGELVLRRRTSGVGGDVLELRANGVFVMDTVETSSEIAMAEVALDLVPDPRDVLVGGLGLGFTLQRVLADVRVEKVAVVEIEADLIVWMRDGTVPHGPALLADRRVTVVNADIAMAINEARHTYDLVLLDVDNGPGYLVHDDNEGLYSSAMLTRCRDLLNPDGVLVIWSGNRAPELLERMRRVLPLAREQACEVSLSGRPDTYWLYVAPSGHKT
jgi:spermidine synthase